LRKSRPRRVERYAEIEAVKRETMNESNSRGPKIIAGKNGNNSRLPRGLFRRYGNEFAMGMVRTDENRIKLVRDIDIVGITALTGDKAAVLAAQNGM
jgi:hypothetical protein